MVLPQKIVVELSDADRRLLKRIAVALEGPEPEPVPEVAHIHLRLVESAGKSWLLDNRVGPDGVVRHV